MSIMNSRVVNVLTLTSYFLRLSSISVRIDSIMNLIFNQYYINLIDNDRNTKLKEKN